MKKWQTWLILSSTLLLVAVSVDITVRVLYCTNINLEFNSQEFNNILSPIISFFGFIAVVISILLTLRQIKNQQGTNYFNYYKEQINKLALENRSNNSTAIFSTKELLDFPMYVSNRYNDLEMIPEYFTDLQKSQLGLSVRSEGKLYDKILGNLRAYRMALGILLDKYKLLIDEIESQTLLDDTQKKLLVKELFESQVEHFYSNCWVVENDGELKEIKSKLYLAFVPNSKLNPTFFDRDFYRLCSYIDSRPDLRKLVGYQE
jgi:hypothetical protein